MWLRWFVVKSGSGNRGADQNLGFENLQRLLDQGIILEFFELLGRDHGWDRFRGFG